MFDRFTTKARQAIFWARYEATEFGSSSIESEHLLLGLLKVVLNQRFLSRTTSELIRQEVNVRAFRGAEIIPTSVDIPLSHECKRVLAYSAEEAAWLKHEHIGAEHLLLGILSEEKSLAATILREHGLELTRLRTELSLGSGPVD